MKVFVILSVAAMAAARPQVSIVPVGQGPTTLTRAPAHDSASIESHRLGGNFAYATAEAHAFAQVTPQISRATFPVAETTHTHEPETYAHVTPAKIVTTHHAARPVIGSEPVFGQQAVIGPVRKHTTVHQPIFKQQHVTYSQPAPIVEQQVTHVQPAIATVAHAAPAVAAVGYAAAAPAAIGYAGQGLVAGHGLGLGYAGQGLIGQAGLGYAGQGLIGQAGLGYAGQGFIGQAGLIH